MDIIVEKDQGVSSFPCLDSCHRTVRQLHPPYGLRAQFKKERKGCADDSSMTDQKRAFRLGGERFIQNLGKADANIGKQLSAGRDALERIALPFPKSLRIGCFHLENGKTFPNAETHFGKSCTRFDRAAACRRENFRGRERTGERTRQYPRIFPGADSQSKTISLRAPLVVQRDIALPLEAILPVPFRFSMPYEVNMFFCHGAVPHTLGHFSRR